MVSFHQMKRRHQFPKPTDVCVLDPDHDHDRIVLRSRLYHRAIAEKLLHDPSLFQIAQNNLKRWMDAEIQRNGSPAHAHKEWADIFRSKTQSEILEILTSETYDAERLRSSAPFRGVLTEKETFLNSEISRWLSRLSESTFAKIWENPLDAAYDKP